MGKFSLDISRFVEKAMGDVAKVQQKVCLDLSAAVINDTPVLTGRARANWQPALNRQTQGTLEAEDKHGSATVAKVDETVSGLKLGDTFTLMNNLPYIMALEDGSSQKAPNGMVKRNVVRFPGVVKDAVREVR
jgi:hypothetical protein